MRTSTSKGRKKVVVVLDQGCPQKYTGRYEWKCCGPYWENNEDYGEAKQGAGNNVWQNQTGDALEHAWDLWTWCGSYRAGEGKGWAGQLSSLGERKIATWVINYQRSRVQEVKLKDIREKMKGCLFEPYFWMRAVRTLIVHPVKHWKQFLILMFLFL